MANEELTRDKDKISVRPPCVVLDTNIWRSELLLRNPLGAALLFAVHTLGGCLGLPDVIYDEIQKQVGKAGREATDTIKGGFATIEKIVGYRSFYILPTPEQVQQSITERIGELGPLLKRVPFTLEHAKAALRRVNEESPPNGQKNQQFKDSAIWEAILELVQDYTVYFVTEDKGFFENREPRKGLAMALKEEIAQKGTVVHVYGDLSSCLATLRREAPQIDKKKLGEAIDSAIRDSVISSANNRAFRLGDLIDAKVEAFLTQQLSTLSLSFELTYPLEDIPIAEGLGRTEAIVIARGDCVYSLDSGEVTNFRMNEEEFIWRDHNLNQQRNRNMFAHGVVGGHRVVKYEFRTPLDSEGSHETAQQTVQMDAAKKSRTD